MKKMLKYLSPLAPDQSGAAGVLYELGGIIVICDAGGCAGNICGFDEPRWFSKRSAVFSAGLRDMDAIMGRDDRLIEKLSKAYEQIGGEFAAIVATPVPAVIGTDMKALKRMAEKKLGIPCITVNAIGTRLFDEGEEEAWLGLFREFAGKGNDASHIENDASHNMQFVTGILGATPLETGYSTSEPLIEMAKAYGIENPLIYGMDLGLEAIREIGRIKENLVVTPAGLKTARYLEEECGVPYKVGYPFTPQNVKKQVLDSIERLLSNGNESATRVLIIHTQFAANELRSLILNKHPAISIDVATFFMQSPDYKEEGDVRLSGEDDLAELVADRNYDLVVADGDIERLLTAVGYKNTFVDYPSFAVSGRMNDDSVMFFS